MANDLQHQKSRLVIKEVIEEYAGSSVFAKRVDGIVTEHTGTVKFMEKSQKYADSQIDKRLFKNVRVILGLIVSWIASIAVAVIITAIRTN